MSTKAKDLKRDDALWMNVHGRVLAVAPVANGKRVLIKIALEETSSMEFSDGGFVVEIICKPGRVFSVRRGGWGGDGGDGEPILGPSPGRDLVGVD